MSVFIPDSPSPEECISFVKGGGGPILRLPEVARTVAATTSRRHDRSMFIVGGASGRSDAARSTCGAAPSPCPRSRTRYLLVDRDTKFCEAFRFILHETGVEAVKLPAKSPNLNEHLDLRLG